jgi:tocopherol O-methyltransferase
MTNASNLFCSSQFVSELARVAAPGATIIIVTWCHRDLSPSEDSLKPDEINLLNKICDAYYLPAWCSAADYVNIAKSLSLEVISKIIPSQCSLYDLRIITPLLQKINLDEFHLLTWII